MCQGACFPVTNARLKYYKMDNILILSMCNAISFQITLIKISFITQIHLKKIILINKYYFNLIYFIIIQ